MEQGIPTISTPCKSHFKCAVQQVCDALKYLKAQGFVMFDDIHHSFFEITQEGLSIYESIRMERLEKVVVPLSLLIS